MLPTKFESVGLSVQEKKQQIYFQDGLHGSHLGFPIRKILAILNLQITSKLPSQVGVNWPFSSGKTVKNRFSRWPPWWPSWISSQNNFTFFFFFFDLQVIPMLPTNRNTAAISQKHRFLVALNTCVGIP